jgi:hypothetical protein
MFGSWGLVIYHCKGLENIFPMVYYKPPNALKLQLKKTRKKNM